MSRKRKITASDVAEMSPAERVGLMRLIWMTLDEPDGAFELSETQKAELERRWVGYRRNPERATPWDELKSALLRRGRRTG